MGGGEGLLMSIVFGVVCAILAQSKGRHAVGWFVIGFFLSCIALIVLLVLPDLRVQEERDEETRRENRRLREQLRRDRQLSEQRYQETRARLEVHDDLLGVDTAPPLPGGAEPGFVAALPEGGTAWYYSTDGATQMGPVDLAALQALRREGVVDLETLLWREGLADWTPASEFPELRDRLDA